jgi:dephospho-CoA kinase
MKMIFGLTGGIASGKSTVSEIFRDNGIVIIDADVVAREIVEPYTKGWDLLIEEFGQSILLPNETIDRAKLGNIIFADPQKRERLDAILGPPLMKAVQDKIDRLERLHTPLACFDAALLIEKNLHERFRPLVVVATKREVQVERLKRRNGLSLEEANARIDAQLPLSEKTKLADYVIYNDGSLEHLLWQALDVLNRIRYGV